MQRRHPHHRDTLTQTKRPRRKGSETSTTTMKTRCLRYCDLTFIPTYSSYSDSPSLPMLPLIIALVPCHPMLGRGGYNVSGVRWFQQRIVQMGSERWNGQNTEGVQLLLLPMPSLFNCSISTLVFPLYTIAPFPPPHTFQPIAPPP